MEQVYRSLKSIVVLAVLCSLLAACGGGGSSSSSTTVNGVASKGPIKDGVVEVYAVNADGTRGKLLGTGTTGSDGTYKVQNLSYKGNLIVIVTGGTYFDEATGMAGVPNTVLKAALSGATGSVNVAITPLTDVAFKQMSSAAGGFTKANIDHSNAVVSTAFGVNIIGTQPVDVTDATKVASASSQTAVDYGVALAAISQMVKNGDASDVKDAIAMIQADLSAETPKLSSTGGALTQAIVALTSGPDPMLAPTITTETTSMYDTIQHFTDSEVNPPANPDGVAQAKAMVSDLRNTVLTVVDYHTGDVGNTLKTPFDTTAAELQTTVGPELSSVGDLVGWVVTSIGSTTGITPGTTYNFTDPEKHPGQTLTIVTGSTGTTATVSIVTDASVTLLSGTISVNDVNLPTSGSVNFTTLKTASGGNATMTASYSAAVSDTTMAITFRGKLTSPSASFDFDDSASNRKLTFTLTQNPTMPDSVMLTKAYFSGVATSSTARVTGSINIPTLVWNSNISPNEGNATIPTQATFSGKIEALNQGAVTMTLQGTLTGTFSNAGSYNPTIADGPGNFPQWSGTFNGSLVAGNGVNISAMLKASMSTYQVITFEVKYTRTLANDTTIWLDCNGTYNVFTEVTSGTITNQAGLHGTFVNDKSKPTDSRFSGTIETGGGAEVATFSSPVGVPRVTYDDSYFETLI
ncbi:hypothetical protein [Geomonas ferrireducens]|uniref:hypothetical protein n=1 Tax=Geomonas ferrireducens TaxID=2570227 RepID=UPI0010A802E1|nr:hypothetical protein [Geomonas ferrireducens]